MEIQQDKPQWIVSLAGDRWLGTHKTKLQSVDNHRKVLFFDTREAAAEALAQLRAIRPGVNSHAKASIMRVIFKK
jgi:hypothetical protein